MLNFSKGFNNQNNVNTSKYAKVGRVTPEEIVQKRYEYNMKGINESRQKQLEQQQFKTVQQRNVGNDSFAKLNAFKNINK